MLRLQIDDVYVHMHVEMGDYKLTARIVNRNMSGVEMEHDRLEILTVFKKNFQFTFPLCL